MAWFLAVLFLDIGVSYSLSTLISTIPGAVLVGAQLASFLHLFLSTSCFDALPRSSRRRSAYYWASQVLVDGLLATSIGIASKQSQALCKAFYTSQTCAEARNTDKLVVFMAPNVYIIFLMDCITVLIVLITSGTHICMSNSRHKSQDSDQENSPLENSSDI